MALNVTFNTPATDNTGRPISSAHIRLVVELPDNENKVIVRFGIWYNEQAYLDGRPEILVDEIPEYLNYIETDITPTQYASVDTTNAHNQLKGFIEEGELHVNWPFANADPPYPEFLGIKIIDPLNAVAVIMPSAV